MEISALGLDLIKHFEGCHLESYPDPGTGGEPWTIGYGSTKGVTPGMIITKGEAEEMLREDVKDCEFAVNGLVEVELTQPEFDALVSFVYNCGYSAFQFSTLLKRLNKGAPRCRVYQEELNRWTKGGDGEVLPGLVRRRQEEADMACEGFYYNPVLPMPGVLDTSEEWEEEKIIFPLDVPYYYQRDSKTGHGERMCFSSSMAMAMDYLDPDAMEGDDDWYLNEVFKYGDSVSSDAQLQAATALGFDVDFRTNGTEEDLISQLDKGIPVPIGILHHGHVDTPSGGGHWICLIGYDDKYFYVHDPFGELNLVSGGYTIDNSESAGKNQRYTRKNLMKRWLIANDHDGWGMFFKK